MSLSTIEQIAESLRIEGIRRPPTEAEIKEHIRFLRLPTVSIEDLEQFVSVYQPRNYLRDEFGRDVRIGNYHPPRGGPEIRSLLQAFLDRINVHYVLRDPFTLHAEYEMLHPFTDGNGRSGRILWYWMMQSRNYGLASLGFLHAWYYQTLMYLQMERP